MAFEASAALAVTLGTSSSKRMLPPRSALTVAVAVSPSPSVVVAVALRLTLPVASAICRLLPSPTWSISADCVSVTLPPVLTLMRNTSALPALPTTSPLVAVASVIATPLLLRPESVPLPPVTASV